MDVQQLITVVFTIIFGLFFQALSALMAVLFIYKKNIVNNIDVLVFELNDKGHSIKYEKGRFERDPARGKCLYIVGRTPYSIKANLGYNFSDNHLCTSKNGYFGGRKFIAVACKDQMYAPLQFTKKTMDKLNLTDQEQKVFKDVCSKLVYNVDLDANPETLSLNPILYDQLRFKLDIAQDAQDVYGNKDKEFAKTLIKYALIFLGCVVLFTLIIIIIIITQGPQMASNLSQVALPPG